MSVLPIGMQIPVTSTERRGSRSAHVWGMSRLTAAAVSALWPSSRSESEPELLYDWRFTANQFVLTTGPLRPTTSNFIFQLNICGYSP
jgi:hypothetical protein